MSNLRKILAMALVVAMTFTMLPVFAAADDEIAAVQTVEAPAAEPAPAPAEAPAAEPVAAPVEPVAVEDVAEISAAPAEAAPVAEAIETVAAEAEAPQAELQALTGSTAFATDDEAIAANYFLKLIIRNSSGDELEKAYYNSLGVFTGSSGELSSSKANLGSARRGTLYLLCDYEYDGTGGSATSPLITVTDQCNYFTFDLGGHTLITRMERPLISRGGNMTAHFRVQNGTIFYQNVGSTANAISVFYGASTYVTASSGATVQYTNTYFNDLNVISLAPVSGKTPAPVINFTYWRAAIGLTNSMLISVGGPAIRLALRDSFASGYETKSVDTVNKESSLGCKLNLTGTCVVGSLAPDTAAVHMIYPSLANTYASTLTRFPSFTLNPDSGRTSEILGSEVLSVENDPRNDPSADGQLTVTIPADYTGESLYSLALPDMNAFNGSSTIVSSIDMLEPSDYESIVHAHVNVTHHDAVAATPAAAGNIEHWTCDDCGKYFLDAGCTEATTADAVTIAPSGCAHPDLEEHAAVAATYAAEGNIHYWYCPDCEKFFSDAGMTEIDAATVAIPRPVPDPNVNPESDLVAYGYVSMTIAPDGTKTAYEGIKAAITAAQAWTDGGGAVKLLQDYTFFETTTSNNTGAILEITTTTAVGSWNQDNTYDPEKTVHGFWIDLGGHTLTVHSGRPCFYIRQSVPLSIKNGTVIYQHIPASGTPLTTQRGAVIAWGYSSSSYGQQLTDGTDVFCPEITLKDVNIYNVGILNDDRACSILFLGNVASEVDVINSNLISRTGNAFNFRPSVTNTTAATVESAAHNINILATEGHTSVIGSPEDVAILSSYSTTIGTDNPLVIGSRSINLTTTGGDRIVFLGNALTDGTFTNVTLTYDENYCQPATQSVALPDGDAITETAVGYAPGFLAAQSCDALLYHTEHSLTHVEAVAATDSTNGCREYWTCTACGKIFADALGTEETTLDALTTSCLIASYNGGATEGLVEAFEDWKDAGYTGTITLSGAPNETDLELLKTAFGGNMTYNSSTTESSYATYKILIPTAASNGDLTLDLGDNTIATNALLATAPDLDGFTLKLQNGTVSSTNGPVIVLKGENIGFYLDDMTLTTTKYNFIQDCRGSGSYAILTDSVLNSDTRAPIIVFAWSGNVDADPMLYYVKDCTITAGFTGNTKQAPLARMEVGELATRKFVSVVDGATTLSSAYMRTDSDTSIFYGYNETTGDYSYVYFLTAHGAIGDPVDEIYTLMTDAGVSKLCAPGDAAATLTVGSELTLPFANLSDAVKFAQLFGEGPLATTLTLDEDVTVTGSLGLDQMTYGTAFTLALNGKTITDDSGYGLFSAGGTATAAVTVTGAFGDAATSAKFFAGVPALAYASGNRYVIEKDRFFTNYSLNLEDSVKINLYTDGENGDPDFVSYLQDGKTYTVATPGEVHDWVVGSLAAKQMSDTIDAYAVKASGTTTYVDFSKNVSVKGYVESNPALLVEDGANHDAIVEALNTTLDTMMIYGKLAEKYFNDDYSGINAEELAAIGVAAVPNVDTTGLDDSAFAITGIGNHQTDSSVTEGYYGSAAVLQDKIALKFYFYGAAFAGAATVQIGEAAATDFTPLDSIDGNFKYVEASVSAKDFDTAITVAFDGVGSVTDSVSAYTSRLIASGDNATNLANALRAYGASAKAYVAAKG